MNRKERILKSETFCGRKVRFAKIGNEEATIAYIPRQGQSDYSLVGRNKKDAIRKVQDLLCENDNRKPKKEIIKKGLSLFTIIRDDMFDDGQHAYTDIKVLGKTEKQVKDAYDSKNYFLETDKVTMQSDWIGSEFEIEEISKPTEDDYNEYPYVGDLK